jgi:hypothetical protein
MENQKVMKEPTPWPAFLLVSLFNVALASAVLAGALLRETPLFWQNAGGFPIWLRGLVLIGFYPGLLLSLALTVGGIMFLFKSWRAGSPAGIGPWILWFLQVALLLVALALMSWNNINNVIENAPLHQHSS